MIQESCEILSSSRGVAAALIDLLKVKPVNVLAQTDEEGFLKLQP